MKISDVVYKTIEEVDQMQRFDMFMKPRKAPWYLQLLAWLLSFPETFSHRAKISKINMKGLKPPYIMLCNHNSFLDFKVATRAVFPHSSNYVVAIDGFINREKLLRDVGCIGKRKFISDMPVVRNIQYSLKNLGQICQIYPEARYSLVGTTAILPESLGKMAKLLKYPVVVLLSHGHHLSQPVWNLDKRKVPTRSEMTQIITQEEIRSLDVTEINRRINDAFVYDDYRYQLDNKIKIKTGNRAEKLHHVLYKCPYCGKEFQMQSEGNKIWCENCHTLHEMDEYGRLENMGGETKFTHIPDWFEWEREEVKKEIMEGIYDVTLPVDVDSLPNATGYYRLGRGLLTHNKDGFHLVVKQENKVLDVVKPVQENYSVHVEYDYFGKGCGLSFSTFDDTYYIYPVDQKYSVTKFHFAVEELYKLQNK
ncbi:MAG TPA: hypothetical protein PLH02_06130 [Bacillota bacterium]|nr:hypothetical protein [Bacillota bacterium]HPF42920.1 hypothetical protein [Bacillota bacterium]HPJ86391.1 hypothetical protein [Bacillota bacterium]HPQ62422.1 hypothetical protein [Bacillota bacterium]HRX92164.1 hypothetical protein [Candidatus Izemoplasmatales bacterium]